MSIITDIENKTIPAATLDVIKEDLNFHLTKSYGTLVNYAGKFTKAIVNAAIEHYPDKFDIDQILAISATKKEIFMKRIADSVLNNEEIFVKAPIFQMLIQYIDGNETSGQYANTVVNNLFVMEDKGSFTKPQPKTLPVSPD